MFRKVTAAATLICVLSSTSVYAGGAPAISVHLLNCVAPNIHPKVTATVQPDAVSARVYFKGNAAPDEYYVDMNRNGKDLMSAFLPAPLTTTRTITYRIVTTDARGKQTSSAIVSNDVQKWCPVPSMSSADRAAASAIVIGLTNASQSPVPKDFDCRDVVAYVTVDNVLKNNDACRALLAGALPGTPATAAPATAAGTTTGTTATTAGTTAATTGATTTGATTAAAGTGTAIGVGAGEGLGMGTIAALTAAGLLGAGYIVYKNNKNNEPVSPSRP